MKKSHLILADILKLALGNKKSINIPTECNWKDVRALAERQGVQAIAFDGIQQLPKQNLPDKDLVLEWFGQVRCMECIYEKYITAIRTLGEFCNQQYVPVLLLKGYGCSLNYPVPSHRPCGDIDIYLGKYKSFVEKLVTDKGSDIDYTNEHHSVFTYKGFVIENHETILDVNSHKSNVCINQLLEQLAEESIKNGREALEVIIPSSKFNSIHLLRHMASDFASVRTTLRHVLDWSTFVMKNDVDWVFVHEVAHNSNMDKFLDAINGICVHYLGYPEEKFPIEVSNKGLEERVLNEILTCEDQVDAPQGYMPFSEKLRYGITKTKRLWKNRWKYKIVYDESLFESFVWKARNRWRH